MMGKVPQYQVVAEALRREISELAPNSLLPTEQQLARRFGVSRATLREALDLLERGGLISRFRGRGTVVSPPKITRRFSPLQSFERDLTEQGIVFETRVLAYDSKSIVPNFIRARLRLPSDGRAAARPALWRQPRDPARGTRSSGAWWPDFAVPRPRYGG